MIRDKTTWWFGAAAAALLALTAGGLALPRAGAGQFGIGYGPALDWFVAIALAQGAVYLGAAYFLLRHSAAPPLALILGAAIVLRLTVLVFPPFLSNDIYRYVWDGWVQGAGINPYRFIPADAHLAFLRDAAVFPNINRAGYAHTIYPPAAEMVFFVIAMMDKFLSVPPVFGMKLGMLACEAVGIWAMLRLLDQAGLPRRRILLYAWNPLPVWEFAGSGHVDAIAVGFVALSLLAVSTGRRGWGAALLAAASLTKFLPAVLLPALWRRWDWRAAGVFLGLIVALYLPYLSAGAGVLGFLGGYAAQEHITGGQGIFLLDLAGAVYPLGPAAPLVYLTLLAITLLGIGIAMVARPSPTGAARVTAIARRCGCIAGVLLVGISPHYPWYFAFLLVPACIAPSLAALWLVTAAPLLYLDPSHTGLLWPALVLIPAIALAAGWRLLVWPVATHRPKGAEI